jgi:hypothetical protein
VIQSFSICHPLRSTGVTRLRRYYEMIRLLSDHGTSVVASLGPTASGGTAEISWGKDEKCLAAPAFTTICSRSDIGHRVRRHAHPDQTACLKVHCRSVLRCATDFHLTRPRGVHPVRNVAQPSVRAIVFRSWLPPIGPIVDFHLQSLTHAQRTDNPRYARIVLPWADIAHPCGGCVEKNFLTA